MSEAEDDTGRLPFRSIRGATAPVRRRLLSGYTWLRSHPVVVVVLLGALFGAFAMLLDPAYNIGPSHGVFAGMFGVWAITLFVFAGLIYVYFKSIQLYEFWVRNVE